MKKKVLYRNLIIISSIVLLGVFIYFSQYSQSILSSSGLGALPVQEKEIVWQNINVNISSPYFGYLTSGQKASDNQQFIDKYGLCGDTGGRVSISNNYQNLNELEISSSISGSKFECSGNFIKTNAIFPKGNLTITYSLSATATWGDNGYSIPQFYVNKKLINQIRCGDTGNSGECSSGALRNTQTRDRQGNYTIISDGINPIEIKLITSKSYYGSSSANAKISFTKEPTKKIPDESRVIINNQTNQTSSGNDTTTPTTKENYLPFYILVAIILIIIFLIYTKKKKRVGKRK